MFRSSAYPKNNIFLLGLNQYHVLALSGPRIPTPGQQWRQRITLFQTFATINSSERIEPSRTLPFDPWHAFTSLMYLAGMAEQSHTSQTCALLICGTSQGF